MENVRDASQPSAGAGRDTLRNAIGALIGAGIAWLLPEGTDPQVRVATGAVVWGLVVSPVLALWGKWLRGRGYNAVFALPLALWMAGCTTYSLPMQMPDGEQRALKAMAWGQSRIHINKGGSTDVCSDGVSTVFAGLWTNTVGKVGSVFGSGPSENQEPKDTTTCAILPSSTPNPESVVKVKIQVEPPD